MRQFGTGFRGRLVVYFEAALGDLTARRTATDIPIATLSCPAERTFSLAPSSPRQVFEDQIKWRRSSECEKSRQEESEKQNLNQGSDKERNKRRERRQMGFSAREREIKRAFLSNQLVLVLLYVAACLNTNTDSFSLPGSVLPLLQDFEEVFPDEVPAGLPPTRRIRHQIGFTPRAALPIRPAHAHIYRSSPEEAVGRPGEVSGIDDKRMGERKNDPTHGSSHTRA